MIFADTNNWSGARFGNKLLYLNNLIQIASFLDHEYRFTDFGVRDIFEFDEINIVNTPPKIDVVLTLAYLLSNKKEEIYLDPSKTYSLEPCLFELFFVYDTKDTFDVFKLRSINDLSNKKSIAVHFRGTDFFTWDSKCILGSEYYIKALEDILKDTIDIDVVLLTDDNALKSLSEVKIWLKSNNINYYCGDVNNVKGDFMKLAFSDYLISSPSTFCICAGFCGNKNKKIIHSERFLMDYKMKTNYFRDSFWKHLATNNGNNNYSLYKMI